MAIDNRIVMVISGPKANVDHIYQEVLNTINTDSVRIIKDYRIVPDDLGVNYEP